ncbi:MAG TPA: hypothetical protein VK669_13695 [Candidatus Limnocylindrales bacterium]|nr:hypothetical protein [Candidatus Limnocylindrales bacterium]
MYSVISAACASLAILASGLTGCSGSGSTVTPNQPQSALPPAAPGAPAAEGSERLVKTIDVATSAAEIASKVTAASAYKLPLQGQKLTALSVGRKIRTGGIYDLAYYGGPYLTNSTPYNIYVNCAGTCWGTTSPGTTLGRLSGSTFIHVIDQYVGSTANGRYPYGGGYQVNYNTSGTLQDQDIYNIVYAVAASVGTGYGKMYHVFLQSGVQQCSASAGGCYAQNGGYCAYHGSVDFSDIGHTLYSVEPYQAISGCSSPNGKVVDSTLSTLSHEFFETITDPDVAVNNVAWYNNYGGEIGDICRSSYGNVGLSGYTYDIQREYSNSSSTCTFTQ